MSPAPLLGGLTLALHLLAVGGYGWFRDELYFVACGLRPDWGYVDHPPLIPLIARASTELLGVKASAARLVPALAMAGTVALTAKFAETLGGGRFAQSLAGLAALAAPAYLTLGTILTADALQPLTWTLVLYAAARAIRDDPRWWLAAGVAAGVGLASKYLLGLLLAGLAVGLLATPGRRVFRGRHLWLGAALALLVPLPSLVWQALHGWPFLEFARNAALEKNVASSLSDYLTAQLLQMNPATAPLWLGGLAAFLFRRSFRPFRGFAIAYAVMVAAMVVLNGKDYYLAGMYGALFAAGAVAAETVIRRTAWRATAAAVIVAAGALLAPFALPVLPVERFVAYRAVLSFGPPPNERRESGALPQIFADMFGWPEMAAAVARVRAALPEDERRGAVFFGNNYGEAAAVEVLGGADAPPVIAGHNSYHLWGPNGARDVFLVLARDDRELAGWFRRVEPVARVGHPYAMPEETGLTLWLARGPRRPFAELWPQFKHYE